MKSPVFLSLEEVLFIHEEEIKTAGGEPNIRDIEAVKACVEAPKASFGGDFLYDLFGMASAYCSCFVFRHPFVDGNKRTALASSLTFLYLNGYQIQESYEEELADLVIDLVTKKVSKEIFSDFLKANSSSIT
tara:strand:- start:34561 stop:34956 length:396 start_codon:yes stop_codon:yes gene_type:complete